MAVHDQRGEVGAVTLNIGFRAWKASFNQLLDDIWLHGTLSKDENKDAIFHIFLLAFQSDYSDYNDAMTINSLKIDLRTGRLLEAVYCPSPHQDERPPETEINMVVVHGISLPPGEFGTDAVLQFFRGELEASTHPAYVAIAALRVSSHLYIRRTGEIVQFVPFNRRAWHAGESCFEGQSRCNDFSIGIELEGADSVPYEESQYRQLAAVIQSLMETYPAIQRQRIVGHSDIAPGRKTDPGSAFDWVYLKGLLT